MLEHAIGLMYDRFNAALRQADPEARITTMPMWQFPAVEGSYAPVIYRGMDETYSHFLSEGYLMLWYPAHSAEFLRRPGLPLMGVFDNGYKGDGGDVYLKNLMQVVARGVQGVGVEHLLPFDDPRGADAYRTANHLAKLYGPIFAEAPPANEAAVLYSYAQDVTERRNMMGTPHWERVYALFGAGLMAGLPMAITYEEDVADGWLLDQGKQRVPMLFLAGQTQPLSKRVGDALGAFRAAGGKVFTDSESAELLGAVRLGFKTHEMKSALTEGYAADSWFPLLQPHFEELARALAGSVGRDRRFPVDTDDLWVSKNGIDGGNIRYLMVASETSPYPWDVGTVWSLGALCNKTYLPKTVRLSFPASPGVVYDVFEQTVIAPKVEYKLARLAVNLRTFPGRLYALAPASLGAPRLEAGTRDGRLHYRVTIVDGAGHHLKARVPIRVRLVAGSTVSQEVARCTGADGTLAESLPLPATSRQWLTRGLRGVRRYRPPAEPLRGLDERRRRARAWHARRRLLEACRDGLEGDIGDRLLEGVQYARLARLELRRADTAIPGGDPGGVRSRPDPLWRDRAQQLDHA